MDGLVSVHKKLKEVDTEITKICQKSYISLNDIDRLIELNRIRQVLKLAAEISCLLNKVGAA